MIREIKIENFLSFWNEVTFSFEEAKGDAVNRAVAMPDGVKLLRFAVIFGANASGKSNFLKVFDFIRIFWTRVPMRNDSSTGAVPFLLNDASKKDDSSFELRFYVKDVQYWYKLRLNSERVESEMLYYYPNAAIQPTRIFTRSFEDGKSVVKFNPAAVKIKPAELDAINVNCWKNMSLFATLTRVNVSMEVVDVVREWISKKFLPNVNRNTELSSYAKKKLLNDTKFKNYLLNFAKKADFRIEDINVKETSIPLSKEQLDYINGLSMLDKKSKAELNEKRSLTDISTEFLIRTKGENGDEFYYLPEEYQSDGTTRMLEIESTIYTMLEKGAFLAIDEIEASLHPNLLDYILTEFLKVNDNESQLLVSSHYDPLLKAIDDLYGKDSVWFTEKNEDGGTELYSLVEFKGLYKLKSIHNAYKNGQFGAIPEIFV